MFSEITQIITIYLANSVVSCTYSYPCIEKKKKNKEMQRIPWNVTHIGLWFVVSSPSLQNISTLAKQKGVSYNTGFRFKYLGVCVFWNQLHIR